MEIKTLEFAGLRSALHGMRNPMNSWEKADSKFDVVNNYSHGIEIVEDWSVGDADKDLSVRLQTAGPEHCKHLRQIMVWADITAPRYWWNEFDTYRIGVEKVSCSTMHKLMDRELTLDDFEFDEKEKLEDATVFTLNSMITVYKEIIDADEKKKIWRKIIQHLPQSYLQKRTVMMSYAALRTIYRQRKWHKLREWEQFRKWAESLPESWMITDAEG